LTPESPVVPGAKIPEVVYAADRPEYLPLPTIHRADGVVLSRCKLDWRERLRVLWTGNVYLSVSTFNTPLQPLRPSTFHWWNEPGDPYGVTDNWQVRCAGKGEKA